MLIRTIEKFLRHTGMPWTRFGRLATHDPRFVGDLRRGRTPRAETVARVERFMARHLASLPCTDAIAPDTADTAEGLFTATIPETRHAD